MHPKLPPRHGLRIHPDPRLRDPVLPEQGDLSPGPLGVRRAVQVEIQFSPFLGEIHPVDEVLEVDLVLGVDEALDVDG